MQAAVEIQIVKLTFALQEVALRKESVDRNFVVLGQQMDNARSLSARRAWIEIISSRGNFA